MRSRTFHQEYRFSITLYNIIFHSFLLFICLIKKWKKKACTLRTIKKQRKWWRNHRTKKTVIYSIDWYFSWDDVCFWKSHWGRSVYEKVHEEFLWLNGRCSSFLNNWALTGVCLVSTCINLGGIDKSDKSNQWKIVPFFPQ